MKRFLDADTEVLSLDELVAVPIASWEDIHQVLDEIAERDGAVASAGQPMRAMAFVTFDFGIDGVSMEIAKYATCLERLAEESGRPLDIRCVAGGFSEDADNVLRPEWGRQVIEGMNGWSKWDDGRWFDRLFYTDMPDGSADSTELATEMWKQGVALARKLAAFCDEASIDLIFPVNVNANPGNVATALALVLVSELRGLPVVNSNHDFFWEGGRPAAERKPEEEAGPRDHFFRNWDNRPFARLIERLYPWDGKHWAQLVINDEQGKTLRNLYGFARNRVCELGTFIEDAFFVPCTEQRRRETRTRLGYILGGGERCIQPEAISDFRRRLPGWMETQTPIILGDEGGLSFDVAAHHAVWFLQPTRVVTRKRIQRNWELIGTLLHYEPFRAMFMENPDLTLSLHVTGPVPIEHEDDLHEVLDAYQRVLASVSPDIARRVFQVFTVGKLGQSGFLDRGAVNLTVADLYHLADLALLPSQTEGRGLPILEAAAAGLPLVCSHYEPLEVFEKVMGEDLERALRIRHSKFPEGKFPTRLLQEITDMVFLPNYLAARHLHNRAAVAARCSIREVSRTLEDIIESITSD